MPDILVLLADDLGYADLSYNGATEIETPNIDRLAREGVVFTAGYTTHSVCTPSRAGLLTGRYPARFGMDNILTVAPHDNSYGLPASENTFAKRLQQAGYATALVGKWHLGAAPRFHPLRRGFDDFYGFRGGARGYYRADALDALDDNRGNGLFDGYLTDALTDQAIALLRERKALATPLLLILAWNAPHSPLQAPPQLVEGYEHVANEARQSYLAMVDSLDQNVGRLLDALEANGRRGNTLVFFLSDNGGVWPWRPGAEGARIADNTPLRNGKTSLNEGGIRVPFIASWPQRWPQGVHFHAPVISMDIAATALALAGVSEDRERPLDGVNLDDFVLGRQAAAPHPALFWRRERPDRSVSWAVRVGDMKLTKATPDAAPALYDLAADVSETRNLIDDRPEEAARLAGLWNAWNEDNPRNAFPHHRKYDNRRFQLMDEMFQEAQENARRPPFAIRLAP